MKTIRLLLIAPAFYPVHSGAGLRFFRYLGLFHENNIQVSVICGTPKLKKYTREDFQAPWNSLADGALVLAEEISQAKIFKYKLPAATSSRRIKILLNRALEFCNNHKTKPDVVHIIAPMPFAAVALLKKLRRSGAALVYSHTIAGKVSANPLLGKIQALKTCRVLNQYSHIIVPSRAMKNIILKTNPKADIHIIPNGVDTGKFSPVKDRREKRALRKQLNLPLEAALVTLVGAIHPRKGTHVLIDAWSRLADRFENLHLVLIGPEYHQSRPELASFKRQIDAMIERSGQPARVHFTGAVDNVCDYLKASDLFVFPSEREGMPNAVLEAMSAGLPVVLTPFTGFSQELGEHNKHYLLAERTSQAIQESMAALLANRQLSRQLSANARQWMSARLDVSLSARSHARLYKSAALRQL